MSCFPVVTNTTFAVLNVFQSNIWCPAPYLKLVP